MPVDHSVSALANLIRNYLRSLATHTHTYPLLPRIHTQQNKAHHPLLPGHNPYNPPPSLRCDSQLSPIDILSAPSLPSFISLPPSFKQTHHSLFFFPSTQNPTTPHPSGTQTGPARRRSTETPPFFQFRARRRNAILCVFLLRTSQLRGLVWERERTVKISCLFLFLFFSFFRTSLE